MNLVPKIHAIAYSVDSQEFAVVDDNSTIWFGEFGKVKLSKSSIKIPSKTYSLAYQPSDKIISSASVDGVIRFWDKQTGQLVTQYQNRYGSIIHHEFSENGSMLLATDNTAAYVWDVRNNTEILECYAECDIVSSTIIENRLILLGDYCGNIYIREISTRNLLRRIKCSEHIITGLAYNNDKNILLVWDSVELTCWSLNGKFLRKILYANSKIRKEYNHSPAFGCFSSKGDFVVSLDVNYGYALILNTDTGELLNEIRINDTGVRKGVLSSNDRYLLTLSFDNTVRLWDIQSGLEIGRYRV